MIWFSHATFVYRDVTALEDLTLHIAEGEFAGIIGPNGSGKTTFMKGILGLMAPVSGTLQVFDCDCTKMRCHHRARIGYLPQKALTDPYYPVTVQEVAMMGRYGSLGLFRRPSKADRVIVLESLDAVGMADAIGRPFGTLSGGQQQRVLIARAIAQRPEVLLLDEPTTGIDATAQHHLIDLILALRRSYHLTVLFCTHDINMISPLVDSLILLKTRLHAKGPPKEVLTREILSGVYGPEVALSTRETCPYVIVSDAH